MLSIIKRAREAKGLSLRKLSELTGIAPANLCKIEKGETDPRLSTMKTICEALGLTIKFE